MISHFKKTVLTKDVKELSNILGLTNELISLDGLLTSEKPQYNIFKKLVSKMNY